MRALRLTMLGVTALLVGLSGLFWYRGVYVVDFAVKNAVAVHFLGHRTYFIEVCCTPHWKDSGKMLSLLKAWCGRLAASGRVVQLWWCCRN